MVRNANRYAAWFAALVILLGVAGCRRHKYDNPITKDTQQPDKVLFDRAVDDIERGRYERARLVLQTLMNTYDTSEYLAKAKLAEADSWYREGGSNGLAQAEFAYKDFILFYPQMEEAAEAQEKICKMQYQQMDKSDRDPMHALRAEDECRQVLVQFPNSKFAPEAQQLLRNIQEVRADAEYKVGLYYRTKGNPYASANRLQALTDQFPLYSHSDEALWELAEEYGRMGDKFENQQASAYAKIVRDYPLSPRAEEAKARLQEMNRAVPEPDPVAYSRMKYEAENRTKRGLLSKIWGPFSGHPNMSMAAKSGTPQMTGLRPTIPKSVPAIAAGTEGTSDVTASVAADPSVLETNPEARANPAAGAAATPPATTAPATTAPGTTAPTTSAPGTTPPVTAAPANAAPASGATAKSAKPAKKAKKPPKKKKTDKNQPPQPPKDQSKQ